MKIDELNVADLAIKLAQVGESLGIANLDPTSGMIFLTSASGVVGHRVAARLLNAGYPKVRIGVKDREEFEGFNKLGAELADFDWMDETTYDKALVGVKSVFCNAPHVRRWHQKFPVFLQACERAGVKHYVKISFYHARKVGDPFQAVPFVKFHGACDEWLASGKFKMSYTILSASHFMSNPLTEQGYSLRVPQKPATFYGASDGNVVNYVSPNDVAEVAVHVLLSPKSFYDKEYTLTGPKAITDEQVATYLSDHLKKTVTFVDQPIQVFRDEEEMGGDAKWLVADLVAMEKVKAQGLEELMVSDDIETITGHPPEDYDDYLRRTESMTAAELA